MISVDRSHFIDTVWDYYAQYGRHDLPWRTGMNDEYFQYHVLVSEIMLQQTQVNRVIQKYKEWIAHFPTPVSVADAPFSECLGLWTGLGYNRRARFLHEACKKLKYDHNGNIPSDVALLTSLPGIGINTAGAIAAYGFNKPELFIETNIRTVYINHFFGSNEIVTDSEIRDILSQTLDREHPREWYWALMDYGTYLKRTRPHVNDQSAHYVKQSKFEGSRRQVRSQVLRAIQDKPQSLSDLSLLVSDERLGDVVMALEKEGFIRKTGVIYTITT